MTSDFISRAAFLFEKRCPGSPVCRVVNRVRSFNPGNVVRVLLAEKSQRNKLTALTIIIERPLKDETDISP